MARLSPLAPGPPGTPQSSTLPYLFPTVAVVLLQQPLDAGLGRAGLALQEGGAALHPVLHGLHCVLVSCRGGPRAAGSHTRLRTPAPLPSCPAHPLCKGELLSISSHGSACSPATRQVCSSSSSVAIVLQGCPSVHPSIHPSIHPPAQVHLPLTYPFIYPSIHSSTHPSICGHSSPYCIHPSTHPCVHLSFPLSVHPSFHPSKSAHSPPQHIHLSIHVPSPTCLSIHPCSSYSVVYSSIHPSIHSPTHPCLSCSPVYPFIHQSIHMRPPKEHKGAQVQGTR